MRLSITLLIAFLTSTTQSQTLEGLWISAYQGNVQQHTSQLDPKNEMAFVDHLEIDTFYQEAFGLIEFSNATEITFKGLGKPEKQATFKRKNDTLISKIDTTEIALLLYEEQLTLLSLDSSWQSDHFVFEPLFPKTTTALEITGFDVGSYWQVNADTNSLNFGLELFFLDSNEVAISQFYSDYSRTSMGDYNTDTFRNNLFLYVFDQYTLDQKMIRLYDWDGSFFKAQSYEFDFGDEPPILTSFTLSKCELPTKRSKKSIKKKLIGSWELMGTGIPFYPEFSEYDTIEDEFFNFSITKSDFELKYGATFIKEDQKDLLTETLTGTWALGPTGKYLELTYADGGTNHLTINELSKSSFAFNLSLKTPDSNHGFRSRTIQMKVAARR